MVAFPLGKLVYLGMKQISKPIANQVKIAAKRSPFFGKYVCSLPAHALHKLEMFVKYRLMGGKGAIEYAPLSQEKAVELGSEMLGEFVIYATAASYIIYEYVKSVKKDKLRDNTQDEQSVTIIKLNELVNQMEGDITMMKSRIQQLEQSNTVAKSTKK